MVLILSPSDPHCAVVSVSSRNQVASLRFSSGWYFCCGCCFVLIFRIAGSLRLFSGFMEAIDSFVLFSKDSGDLMFTQAPLVCVCGVCEVKIGVVCVR